MAGSCSLLSLCSVLVMIAITVTTTFAAKDCNASEEAGGMSCASTAENVQAQEDHEIDAVRAELLQTNVQRKSSSAEDQFEAVRITPKSGDLEQKLATSAIAQAEESELTRNMTTDPDENDENARDLLLVSDGMNVSIQKEMDENKERTLLSVNRACPQRPNGWIGCAWGGKHTIPAFCANSNRYTLNNGVPINFQQCAFLTANSPACASNYFYTTSTSSSTTGVCKCCINDGPYYVSSSCNWVYYASPSCNIR